MTWNTSWLKSNQAILNGKKSYVSSVVLIYFILLLKALKPLFEFCLSLSNLHFPTTFTLPIWISRALYSYQKYTSWFRDDFERTKIKVFEKRRKIRPLLLVLLNFIIPKFLEPRWNNNYVLRPSWNTLSQVTLLQYFHPFNESATKRKTKRSKANPFKGSEDFQFTKKD